MTGANDCVVSLKGVDIYHTDDPFSNLSERTCMRDGELVLADVNLEVSKGEFVYLIGRVGSGKSSLLKTLYAEIPLLKGEGEVAGFGLRRLKRKNIPYLRRNIGIVFQDSVLDARLTVSENLRSRAAFYGITGKNAKITIEKIAEEFRLTDLLKRPYGKLSGGQRRRVDIARVLIHEPELLFMDEPTTGLDPATRGLVWEIVDNRLKNGLTVFLTTHYMEESVRADKVVVIDEGKIIVSGSPDELKNRYAHDKMRIVTDKNETTERLLYDKFGNFLYKNGAYEVNIPHTYSALNFLQENEVKDFEILKGNMDDVFLNVTGKTIGATGEVK